MKSLAWTGVVSFLAGILLAILRFPAWWVAWACGAVGIVMAVRLTRPLAVYPEGISGTVGDLAQAVFDLNVGRLAKEAGEADRTEIWRSVLRLVADEFGVQAKDLSADTRFVEDLNG